MIQLNFKFFNVLCCFIVLFWFFLSVLHEIMPDLSCPSPLFAFILWLELASRRWQVMPGVLSGVPLYASTPWKPDSHSDMYKVAQPSQRWLPGLAPGTALLAPKGILAPSSHGSAWHTCWNHRALL